MIATARFAPGPHRALLCFTVAPRFFSWETTLF